MDHIKYFEKTLKEVCRKTRTRMPAIAKDNRLGKNYVASVFSGVSIKTGKITYFMRYNKNLINKMSKANILHVICHEIGHVRTTTFECEHKRNKIEEEYKAERFALRTIKKHFPKQYPHAIQYLKSFLDDYDRDETYKKMAIRVITEMEPK